MCGIAGFVGDRACMGTDREGIARRMIDRIRHRGPDAQAVWCASAAPVVLAHARLSIIDLEPTGAQPMASASGRFQIAYNGEVYNFPALRAELEGEGFADWRGGSDTEVLLAAIEHWGLHETLERVVGMFAFAVWDAQERTLSLARDRFGEKPLYVKPVGDGLLFASELLAIEAHPLGAGGVDPVALGAYLRHGCVPGRHAMIDGVTKLEPGTVLQCGLNGVSRVTRYWSTAAVAAAGQANPFGGSDEQAVDQLDDVLGEAVAGQMLSDVPLGAFLSGGIDSSLVVALMQARSSRPIRTFSIGFDRADFDEAPWAKRVAQRLRTEHTELYVGDEQVLDLVPRLAQIYSEPFADSSQLPTLLVSALAREHVTVALSGDAGDEIFCGYNRYRVAQEVWPRIERIPAVARAAGSSVLQRMPVAAIDRLASRLPVLGGMSRPGEKLARGAELLACPDIPSLYAGLSQVWRRPEEVLDESLVEGARARTPQMPGDVPDALSGDLWMMLADQLGYLPDDILVKVDRAAMSVSLETRAPFLDHRVAAFGWSLPAHMRIRHGAGKWVARSLLKRYLPVELVERPKMGFSIPLQTLLRGPLRAWADEQLDPERLRGERYFREPVVTALWRAHRDRGQDHTARLWALLMFQSWLAGR